MRMRRVVQAVVFAATLAAVLWLQTETGRTQARPNVVLLVIDDLNVRTLQTMVDKGLMPNLKTHVIDKAYNFTEAYVTRSMGVPSRATSLTGLYAHNHGVLGHLNETNGGISRFNASSTIGTWLRGGGYRTGYIGKYLSGYGTYTSPTYVPPGWDSWTGLLEPNYHSMDAYALNFNGSVIDFTAINQATGGAYYQTDLLTLQAGNFISAAPLFGKPFFLYLAPTAVNMELPFQNECPDGSALWGGNFWGATGRPAARHLNTIYGNTTDFAVPQSPSFNEEDVSDKPLWVGANPRLTAEDIDCLQRNYWRRLEMLRSVDDMVGYVFARLQATGALANTVVIVTSDNGLYFGEHRFGEKSSAYEESIRVPLYIRAPWTSVPRTVTKIALNNDLAPTIAGLASVLPWHVPDGRSLVPVLENPNIASWRKIFLIEHWFEVPVTWTTAPTVFAVRTDASRPRLFARYPTVTEGLQAELYDMSVDPFQLGNLIQDPARQAEATRLELWLNALKTCRGLTCGLIENLFTFE
jgi:N-acetylglucosamine-6-sulfatase